MKTWLQSQPHLMKACFDSSCSFSMGDPDIQRKEKYDNFAFLDDMLDKVQKTQEVRSIPNRLDILLDFYAHRRNVP